MKHMVDDFAIYGDFFAGSHAQLVAWMDGNQVRDPVREHAGLARARAGDHEQRPLGGANRLLLGRVQVREITIGSDGAHAPDASGAAPASFRA